MPDGITFDGRGLDGLARDMRRAAHSVRREVDKTLYKIGGELLIAAKAIASQHSATVAETIRMRALPGMVVIAAGNDQTPIAALWETGNKGSKVKGLYFRHPVFGSDVWVEQRRYPFLRPALAADRHRIKKLMDETYDRALEPHRLKPDGLEA